MSVEQHLQIPPDLAGQTIAAAIKRLGGERSWSEVKRLIAQRHVKINGTLALDEARRMKSGEVITLAGKPAAPVPRETAVSIVHLDDDLVVVDKPAGIQTVRRFEERDFSDEKKRLQPTLDEVVTHLLARLRAARGSAPRRSGTPPVKVRAVHRLDRDTSGLMLFALSPQAESELIKQFAAHRVRRVYTAVVHGRLDKRRTIETWLVRDRGDGLRGSTPRASADGTAQQAITYVKPIKHLGDRYTIVECRLETGRTHQIRIHLSEIGHRLCGEMIYTRRTIGESEPDTSGAPRQALHSGELQLMHPITRAAMRFQSPLPKDLEKWMAGLR